MTNAAAVSAQEVAALRDSVREVIRRRGDHALRDAFGSASRYDADLWTTLCQQVGVAALAIPEEYGGVGASWLETAAVTEELGGSLSGVPMLASAVMATGALLLSGDDAVCTQLLPDLADGSRTAALCWSAHQDWNRSGVAADAGLLTGTANYVINAESADLLVVFAGSAADTRPATLHYVDAATAGVDVTPLPVLDPTRPMARVTFNDVPASAVSSDPGVFSRLRDLTWALLAVEQVGGAAAALDLTVEYTKSRKQFGRVIGSFQALKHRMADMYADVETSRSIAYAAVEAIVSGAADASEVAASAHVYCSEAFRRVTGEAIQLHGGIGITWEHDIQLYFKRAQGSSQLLGQPHEVIAELSANL
ncbi:putative acyl-CoA dehydrogenase [Gordonia effusa NBRC 100432]|uniref:Putative acyl-CoA dehydrogenase n=1 Tax=Gordonia effusa NBRC 100432 TaxID=1077974 RepID=H0R4H2_9ACTN|nr:acyl-CoA dehydrogenase family protein [Gordonia effusa]GAB19973.1 putative acyl-CoA dehydrogenase [Gordonia effusa NBRC 100432]